MDVTKVNFDLIADDFISLLEDCEFYTVDQEMTGITIKGNDDNFGMSLEESYLAKKPVGEHFLAFQLGICLFTKKENAGSGAATAGGSAPKAAAPAYDVRPFNFWLRAGADGPDVAMSMSALDFHCKNKLSLQKWMNEGINYVDGDREALERSKLFPSDPTASLSQEEKEWVREQLESIKVAAAQTEKNIARWHNEQSKSAEEEGDEEVPAPSLADVSCFKTEDTHIGTNTDLALYFALEEAGLTLIASPALDGGCPTWKRVQTTYTVATAEEYNAKKADDCNRRENILSRRIGFRKVWNALEKCGKTHIGHNYFTDILFFMQIHNNQLASTLQEHQARCHKAFPSLMDTKILLTNITPTMKPFAKTALEPAYEESEKRVSKLEPGQAPVTVLPLGFEKYHKSARKIAEACNSDSTCAHHAAFDAYMTGVLFLNLRALYGVQWENKWENHIAIFGSCYVWRCDRTTDVPTYAHGVPFHIEFPKSLRRPDIEPLLLAPEQVIKYEEAEAAIKAARLEGKNPLPKPFETGMYFGWLGDEEAVVATKIWDVSPKEILARVAENKKRLPEDAPQQQVVFVLLEDWKKQDEPPTKRPRLEK